MTIGEQRTQAAIQQIARELKEQNRLLKRMTKAVERLAEKEGK